MNHSPNRILAALSESAYAAVLPYLKIIEFKPGVTLSDVGSVINKVYFPHTGIISLVVELDTGEMVETAMVGRDGVVNAGHPP